MGYIKKPLKFMIIAFVALLLLLCTTDPSRLPSAVLVVPFLLVFGFLTAGFGLLAAMRGAAFGSRQAKTGALWAALPTLLLVLQSVGQLTIRDVLTIIALFAIGSFYIVKRRSVRAQ